ncbi:NYN domain-containing protein [Lentinula aciculospora]|uniref:NYN domain-containing protein n=1 Tax=Lentinula aciculospora TaxID=153920 RepID=A0A9W9AU90_9AGAR|nr:NYN domain-containing protein [Lentinula aciculospora]
MKSQEPHIAIFWDYENCSVPSNSSGYDIVRQIRNLAHEFGSIRLLKAYTQLSDQAIHSPRSVILRSELQSSGVSITDCPHNNYKNVADQMIIVDMLAFAMDNPSGPDLTTIMLISGDRDFAYALSTLQLRRYNVVVVAPTTAHPSLRAQASRFFEWNTDILASAGKEVSTHSPSGNRSRSNNDIAIGSPGSRTTSLAASGGSTFLSGLRASYHSKENSKSEGPTPKSGTPSRNLNFQVHQSSLPGIINTDYAAADIPRQTDKCYAVPTSSNTQVKPLLEDSHTSPKDMNLVKSNNALVVAGAQSEEHVHGGRVMLSSLPNLPIPVGASSKTVTQIKPPKSKHDLPTDTISSTTLLVSSSSTPSISPRPVAQLFPGPKSIPQCFLPLVHHLERLRRKGILAPSRSDVSSFLVKADKQMYQRAGCTKFKDYASKAEKMGLIQLGGKEEEAWIGLHPDLHGRIELNF